MSTVISSMSEIVRVGGWALRGIGYPFGVAERGVRLLAWTEAAGGKAIAALRLAEAAVERSHAARPSERTGDAGSGRTLHAKGRHLIEIGAPAIDLVTHDARHASMGHVALDGVFGLGFLPSLANLLAQRKLSGILVYGAADGDQPPAGWSRTGWLSVTEEQLFAHGALGGAAGATLRRALTAARETISATLIDRALADIECAAAAGSTGYVGVLALSDGGVLVRDLLETRRSPPEGVETVDFPGRVAEALSQGVPIDADDLKYLYDLELRTWAPTSERSRSQAGYGVY